jgi:hypothetical protein
VELIHYTLISNVTNMPNRPNQNRPGFLTHFAASLNNRYGFDRPNSQGNSNIKYVAFAYIRLLKINVTASSFENTIEEHPAYPSLLSVSETFDQFNITNAAYNIASSDFPDLESPFIALTTLPGGSSDFVLVTNILSNSVTYIYREDWPETIQLDVFIKGFKGVCFWAEPNENSGEKDFDERNKRERTQRKSRMISKVAIAVKPG